MTLETGDICQTGVPAPVVPLEAGDQIEITIEGLGSSAAPKRRREGAINDGRFRAVRVYSAALNPNSAPIAFPRRTTDDDARFRSSDGGVWLAACSPQPASAPAPTTTAGGGLAGNAEQLHELHCESETVLYKGDCSTWTVEKITIAQ